MKVIADLSCNWDTLDDILTMIENIQCDAIKLQYYSQYDLYGSGSTEAKLKLEWFPIIKEHCEKHGEELLCTVFHPIRVAMIDKYLDRHKVASSEITDIQLLKEINKYKKPVILSTGGASYDRINTALEFLDNCDVTLMACDIEYPAKRHQIINMYNLSCQYPDFKIGYSDHTVDICTFPNLIKQMGASLLEKHVKPNGSQYEPHALTVNEFNEMMDRLGGIAFPIANNPHQRVYNEQLDRWVRPIV